MKILHQLGHSYRWNLDSYFENKIGDGFIFSVFNFNSNVFDKSTLTTKGYKVKSDILPVSLVDLQYYGKKQSKDLGQFESYPFHPANYSGSEQTSLYGPEMIFQGIQFQERLGLDKIIIPNFYYDHSVTELIQLAKSVNKKLKKGSKEYYMTLPLSFNILKSDEAIEEILIAMTEMGIKFDGFYIVAEPNIEYKHKLCIDYEYLENLFRILKVLKKNKFKIIYGYSNWDSILFTALNDIDYITIGTYENLRNFRIKRFREDVSGGPSKGAYFSSKALNFIKAEELSKFRRKRSLDLIRNDDNIFSDIILADDFLWESIHNADVQKNYLLEITKLHMEFARLSDISARKSALEHKIKSAISNYKLIHQREIYLETESSDYHLEPWLTFLKDKKV